MPTLRTKTLCAAKGFDPSRGSPKLLVNCPGSTKSSPAPAFHDTYLLFQMIGSSDDGFLEGEKLNDGMLLKLINIIPRGEVLSFVPRQ